MPTPELEFLRDNAAVILDIDADVFPPENLVIKCRFGEGVTLESLVRAGYLHVHDKENFLLQFSGGAVNIAGRWLDGERARNFLLNEGWRFMLRVEHGDSVSGKDFLFDVDLVDPDLKKVEMVLDNLKKLVKNGFLTRSVETHPIPYREMRPVGNAVVIREKAYNIPMKVGFTEKGADIVRRSWRRKGIRNMFANFGIGGRESLDIFEQEAANA